MPPLVHGISSAIWPSLLCSLFSQLAITRQSLIVLEFATPSHIQHTYIYIRTYVCLSHSRTMRADAHPFAAFNDTNSCYLHFTRFLYLFIVCIDCPAHPLNLPRSLMSLNSFIVCSSFHTYTYCYVVAYVCFNLCRHSATK